MRASATRTAPQLNDLLGKLGMSKQVVNEQSKMLSRNRVGVLKHLSSAYGNASKTDSARFNRIMAGKGRLPPRGWMISPSKMMPVMAPLSGSGFHGSKQIGIRSDRKESTMFRRLFNPRRRNGAKLERLLRNNQHARTAFESSVGGHLTEFGRRDGRMTVQRFSPGYQPMPQGGNPMANTIYASLAGMENAILAQARKIAAIQGGQAGGYSASTAGYGNSFNGLVLSGMSGLYEGGMDGAFGSGAALGGLGTGSWNPDAAPGRINNTNPLYERAHQSQVSNILADPSLTIEDKVTLMLMTITNKADNDIQRQAQYVNAIQQQQSNRGGSAGGASNTGKASSALGKVGTLAGGAVASPINAKIGGAGGVAGAAGNVGGLGNNSPSIDVETLKLKRMIDKRSQMFDTIRSIIDKYNETAKNIIQSIGR